MHVLSSYLFSYWRTLPQLFSPSGPMAALDTPLPQAFRRSRSYTSWSGLLLWLGIWARWHQPIHAWVTSFTISAAWIPMVYVVIIVMGSVASMAAAYGLLRLYTLVHHVMVSNVFKVRGQRLRLLNVETSLLPLTAVVAVGMAIGGRFPVLGNVLMVLTSVYGLGWFSYAHNVIFHKRGIAGVGLVVGGVFVTAFVFCVGAIAIAVGFGVIAFIIAAIVRPFHRG